MFSKGIYETALTGEIADRLFLNITADNAIDLSFLTTLRALLRTRLPQHETVQLSCRELHITEDEIAAISTVNCMNMFIPADTLYPTATQRNIYIVYTSTPEAGEKMLEIIRANAGAGKRYMGSYTRREDLRVFFARKLHALFYTDDAGCNTVIFTDRLELKHFHALQMMIPRYLPALFTDKPFTETETALLKSAGNKSAIEYESLIGEYAKDLDIRSEIIRTKLAGFETAYEQDRIHEIKKEINNYQADYDRHLAALRKFTRQIQEYQYILAGLECSVNGCSGDSELMEYFICNKNLTIINTTGTALEFIAHGYADIFDAEAFEKYVGNHNGFMYGSISSTVTKVQQERLYRSIFSEGRYRLRICAAFTADMKTGLKALKNYEFPPESQTYLPNPHIQRHGCIGTYAGRFHEYMVKKDYIGAIEQAAVSARNLNFYDSAVIGGFAFELSYTSVKCIERSDGTLLTPLEAINEMEEGGTVCRGPS